MDSVVASTRVNLTSDERKAFVNRYLKKAQLKVDADGSVSIELPGIKGKW